MTATLLRAAACVAVSLPCIDPALAQSDRNAGSADEGWYDIDVVGARAADATATAAVPAAVPAAADGGWTAVPGTEVRARAVPASADATADALLTGRAGDRFWMTRDGDTFEAISRATTGVATHAERIAAYNGLGAGTAPAAGALLFVPAELLTAPGAAPPPVADPEIREFGPDGSGARGGGNGASDAARAEDPAAPVAGVRVMLAPETRNVDMFVGEVQVLGEVDVTRVAVGNGSVIRAEVLGSGELLVIGQSVGSTSLHLWHKGGGRSDFNIRVSENDPETRVRMERMVRMRVRMVEFRKSALGRLGIDWSDSAAGPSFATAGDLVTNSLYRPAVQGFGEGLPRAVAPFSTYFGIASNITSRINLLAANGDATTLAEPVLSTTNGGSASFLAGGEVPYPSVGVNGQTVVQFKEYGIKLDIQPLIDGGGNVRTLIRTEISQLDPAVSVQGAPGLLTRRAETQVNVRSGETIVISGLLSAESSRDVDMIPGIGRLPIIGSLFRSRNHRNAVTELVIFVTPEVVEPDGMPIAGRERRLFDETTTRLDAARRPLLME